MKKRRLIILSVVFLSMFGLYFFRMTRVSCGCAILIPHVEGNAEVKRIVPTPIDMEGNIKIATKVVILDGEEYYLIYDDVPVGENIYIEGTTDLKKTVISVYEYREEL